MPLSLDPDRAKPPKELGRHLGLFDKPLFRDWLAWWTVFWIVVSGLAVAFPTSETVRSSTLPRWLDVLLAVLFFGSVLGLLPAYGRVLVRRRMIKRRREAKTRETHPTSVDRHQPGPPVTVPTPPSPKVDDPPSAVPEIFPSPARGQTAEGARKTSFPRGGQPSGDQPIRIHSSDVLDLQSNATLTEVSRTLPYPVARATRRLQLAGDAKEAYESALRAGEILSTVLGITAVAWAQQHTVTTDAIDRLIAALKGRGIAQGLWIDAAQSIEKPMVDSTVGLPGMIEALRRVKGGGGVHPDLKAVTSERNAWAHGASPQTKAEAGERLAELLPPLQRALKQCLPLSQHDWLYVTSTHYQRREKNFLVNASRVMGDHPDWDRVALSSSTAVASESFYLNSGRGLIDLTPLVVMRHCPTCRQPEVAYADRLDSKKGVALKTFDRGHPLFDETLVPDIQALGPPVHASDAEAN